MCLLRPSAPPTGAIASGYSQSMWPTPTAVERANEGNVRILRAKVLSGEMTEQEAVDILSKSPFEPQGKIPALWPTPRASENENRQTKPTPSQLAGTHGLSLAAQVGGKLSAAWVTRLMGYPDGWLDLDGDPDPT